MKWKIIVNYGTEYNSPQFIYEEVSEARWMNENWLTIIFTDGEKTYVNASKCYSIDLKRDEEGKEENNNYQ